MSINAHITDTSNKLKAGVDNADRTEKEGLVVATRPLKTFTTQFLFFSNPTYGIDMNQSPPSGGTSINIHNGIDDVYWTASAIVGASRWNFNSSAEAHSGSYSIDGSTTINNDEAQFTTASGLSLSGYLSISGWIFIKGWPVTGTKEVQIHAEKTTYLIDGNGDFLMAPSGSNLVSIEGGQVGNAVDIGDYIDKNIFNTWQRFNIPLSGMALTGITIDSIGIKTVSLGVGDTPSYYLDDIQIQETGLALQYTIEPNNGTWLYVDMLNITIADALDSTLANASMPNLSYDKLLEATLVNGIIFQIFENDEPISTNKFFGILDFLSFPRKNIVNSGCDGVNTWLNLNLEFPSPILLKHENLNKIVISIEDDMSGLLYFRMSLSCREECR